MGIRFLLGLLLVFSSIGISLGAKNILLLNSYHRGLNWSDDIFNGVKQVTDNYDSIHLFTEYMDAKRFPDSISQEILFKLYSTKYRDISFDLIICADNAALDFVIKHEKDQLFKGQKVYCGVNNVEDYQYLGMTYHGVSEREFFIERFLAIKKIVPHVQTIYCLFDKSDFGVVFKKRLEQIILNPPFDVKIKIIDDIDLDSLCTFVSSIKDKSTVIDYVSITRDKYGNIVNNEKISKKIAKISTAPMFSNFDYLIGRGVVGGVYQLGIDQGRIAASIGMRLLSGESFSNIPRVTNAPMQLVIDYKVVKKFGLEDKNFPKDAIVINKPERIYIRYQSEFIVVIISFAISIGIILLLLRNIRRRKKSEQSLLQSEQKFKDIAEMLPQTIYECDLSGNLTFINKQALEMFGYTSEDFNNGVNISQLFLTEEWEKIKQSMALLLRGESIKDPTYIAKRKGGSIFPFEVHSNVIYKEGKPVGFRGLGIDKTKQKEVEQALIDAREKAEQSDKLKSAFLSNMSHEIRTPLNAIIGFSSLISDGDISSDQKLEYKKYIQNSSEYLLNLINDIIDHSRIEAGQLEIVPTEFNLYELMKELYLNFQSQQKNRHKEHVQLVYENLESTEQIVIYADPIRIKQVVANLLDNAFKFTDNGSIRFGYETQNDDHIYIKVKDSGIGISDEDKPLVFKRFYKLCNDNDKLYGGSGLGLSICKNLVELMNGKIWLESKKCDGTTFFMDFPVRIRSFKQVPIGPQSNNSGVNYDWSNKSILIAEDELSNYELIKALLKNTKARVLHANNGKEAVDITLSNPVDVILMDIQMPILNGHEAIRLIRHHKPKIPIIAQTAYAMTGEKEEILRSGSDAYLAKPLDKILLLETINDLLTQSYNNQFNNI